MGRTELDEKLQQAIWIARSLFDRGKTSGSSANLSFLCNNNIYITSSGSCFGNLVEADFSQLSMDGRLLDGKCPSKEAPLHIHYYNKGSDIQAIIHTHGPYTALWSCRTFAPGEDIIPNYTPYLEMKVGKVALVPYGKPGSGELFNAFKAALAYGDAFLLKNHGAIVGSRSLLDAFYSIEELEDSARIAYMIEGMSQTDKLR